MTGPTNSAETFVRERCVADPKWFEHSPDLWNAYLAWCRERSEAPVSRTAFGLALRAAGCANRRGHVVTWLGIRLK